MCVWMFVSLSTEYDFEATNTITCGLVVVLTLCINKIMSFLKLILFFEIKWICFVNFEIYLCYFACWHTFVCKEGEFFCILMKRHTKTEHRACYSIFVNVQTKCVSFQSRTQYPVQRWLLTFVYVCSFFLPMRTCWRMVCFGI